LLDFFEENKADKKSVLINLGGGVISDLGGFAACIFKRGFAFVNIPTTLLSQVDASIGGKTGVNYNGLKNEIGVIREPDLTIIDTSLLKTLDSNSILSGFAEMLKHGLIHDETHFEELLLYIKPENLKANTNKLIHHIEKSISIKNYYIEKDLNEEGIRKALNFGHTFGHAIESLYFELNKNISHGKAVAYGMICELFISNKKLGFNQTKLNEISEKIISFYGKIEFSEENKNKIIEIIKHDKKNFSNIIYCTLLKEVGVVEIQQVIDEIDIEESIKYLNKIL